LVRFGTLARADSRGYPVRTSSVHPNVDVNPSPKEGRIMKIQLNKYLALHASLVLAMALALGAPGMAQSMDHSKMDHAKMDHSRMDQSKMKSDHMKEMMAEMKAQDAELTAQVARMNSASKESKVDLMAEIITKMVEQRTAMNARMEQMHGEMMKHMQMGMGSKPHHSKMKGMDKKAEEMPKEQK
jgi:hypothetical protein